MNKDYYYFFYPDGLMARTDEKIHLFGAQTMANQRGVEFLMSRQKALKFIKFHDKEEEKNESKTK